MSTRPVVPVLDVAPRSSDEARPLADHVLAAGFAPRACADVQELTQALEDPNVFACVAAFDCLAPSPQGTVQRLTAALGERRSQVSIVVGYDASSPRSRLVQRLWDAALIDAIVETSEPAARLSSVLRQAYADRFIALPDAAEFAALTGRRLAALHTLAAQFAKHSSVQGIIREVQANLPQLLPCLIAQVMIIGPGAIRLHSLPVRALPQDIQWNLTEQTCAAVAPFLDVDLTPQELEFEEHPPLGMVDEEPSSLSLSPQHAIVVPLVLQGEVVGALSTLFGRALQADDRLLVSLLALHLAPCIKNILRLRAAEEASIRDPLTGAFNRRHLDAALSAELERAGRYDFRLSVAMLDLDHFKRINDTHGHLAGDAVLKAVTGVINKELRSSDQLVRYGGEEFALLLPETGIAEALVVVERIRAHLEQEAIEVEGVAEPLRVTLSGGLAAYPECRIATGEKLLALADDALLRAKRSGRNCVFIASAMGAVSVAQEASPESRRQHPRLQADLRLGYVDLPQFEGRLSALTGLDLSIGGVRVRAPRGVLRRNEYGLVYLGSEQRPVLSQVMWMREAADDTSQAGLRFVRPTEFSRPRAGRALTRPPRALIATQLRATAAMVERVLSAAQVPSTVINTEEELDRLGSLNEYTLLVMGESALDGPLAARLRDLRHATRSESAPLRFIMVNESGDKQAMLQAISLDKVEHVVGDDEGGRDQAFFAMLHKMLLSDQFGVDKYLLWGAEVHSWTVTDWESKLRALDEVRSVALSMRCHPRIADLLILATDEMIINGLYLPSSDGKPKPVVVECGSDGRFFGVAVIDEHGLFKSEDMFGAIGRAMEREEEGLPPTAKHASLGLRLMLGGLSQLAINVDPGRCTEVIGVVDLRKSLRDLRRTVPSLGIFKA